LKVKGNSKIVAIKNLRNINSEKDELFTPSFTVTNVSPQSIVTKSSIISAKNPLFFNFIYAIILNKRKIKSIYSFVEKNILKVIIVE